MGEVTNSPRGFLLELEKGGIGTKTKAGSKERTARTSQLEEPTPELEKLWGTA